MASPDPTRTPTPTARRRGLLVAATVLSVLVLFGGGWLAGARSRASTSTAASPARQAQVLQRSSSVMPFDQTKTTHIFKLLGDGGTQVVIANDPADQTQITLVQGHLREEAARFARGDLADPATIHGQDMPGLAALEQAAARGTIAVRYQALANGALLRYTTRDPTTLDALRAWFAAQTSDHGSHAMG
jgi:hypothetical protein